MKLLPLLASLGLLAPIQSHAAGLADLAGAPTTAIVPRPQASADVDESLRFVSELDSDRLLTDPAYAERALGHLERVRPLAPAGSDLAAGLDQLRLITLTSLDRREEASDVLGEMLARRDRRAAWYVPLFLSALQIEDRARAVAVVEAASRNLPASEWAAMREALERPYVWELMRQLHRSGDNEGRARMAEALLRIGWPGNGDHQSSDGIRSILVKARLDGGDVEAAAGLASTITTVSNLLPLVVLRQYDELFEGQDRMDLLRRTLAEEDRTTAAELQAAPDNPERLLERAQLLRSIGRSAEAADLLEPSTRNVAETAAASEHGIWIVNEAGYALLETGRAPEAIRLMSQLVELDIEENADLIGPSINFGAMLWWADRPEQSLAHARTVERTGERFANEYGKMWNNSTVACALAQLGRDEEMQATLQRMRPRADDNSAALMRALLCANDMASAEALMIERLDSDDPEMAVLGLQEYALTDAVQADGARGLVRARLDELRSRPAVRQALDRVGHLLQLPLARAYWGTF